MAFSISMRHAQRRARQQFPLALLVLLPLLAGCTNPPTGPVPTSSQATTAPGETSLPVTVVPATFSPLATPSTERGVVVGRVFRRDGSPIAQTPMHLARVYWNSDKSDGVFAMDPNVAPKAISQVDGAFIFSDIEPGAYVVVVGTPGVNDKTAIYSNAQGQAQVFEINTGKVTNLGDLQVDY